MPDAPCVVLGEEHGAGVDVRRGGRAQSSSQVSGANAVGLGHLGLELLPELAQRGLVGGRRGTDVHGIRDAGQQVVRREVLEGIEARAELVHVEP